MPQILERRTIQPSAKTKTPATRITPSRVDPRTGKFFTLEQELEPFGTWVSDPIWVPPKDSSRAMAESMFRLSRPFESKKQRWSEVVREHRSEFTQVREIELKKASIRLPKGRFFVSVTEQQQFDQITETIPACVQTRLDEFMAGPGKQRSAKVYYLKPLCVEVDDNLLLTTADDVMSAIKSIQDEVFAEYRRLSFFRRPGQVVRRTANIALAIPRRVVGHYVQKRQRALDAYQAQLEFKRRKTAFSAARTHRKYRTDGCTFDEMLALTNPLVRTDVIEQYSLENELSQAKRNQLMMMAAGTIPWFVTLSLSVSSLASLALSFSGAAPLMVCDPAFVAEMPGSKGVLLKIGHFDEVAGITHIEI